MRHDLQGMTQHKWDSLSRVERMMLADTSGLTQQLIGLEGWRVEVVDNDGTTRRFIVSRSTGWGPCHIEVSRRNAHGGPAARASYKSVRKLYQAWP